MRRREFIASLGSAVAWPHVARAQQPAMPVIGFLGLGLPRPNADFVVAFRGGLAEAGYVEGQNVAIEYVWANAQSARMRVRAAGLVDHQVAVIVTFVNSAAHAAKAATARIPIVFMYGGDPVNDGLVASLSKPGGNVTGVTSMITELGGKRLSILHDLVPGAKIAFFSGDSRYLHVEEQRSEILSAANALGRQIIILETPTERDYEAAFTRIVQSQAHALIVGAFTFPNTNKIVALAAHYKVPAMYASRDYVMAGGLMSYSASYTDLYRQVGIYTGRILHGEEPADLPVQRPTKFEFVINLRTAKALGLNLPPTLLAIADEVIE
jgi:putative tryptophan/tyrosine transport system substrate-binding protein